MMNTKIEFGLQEREKKRAGTREWLTITKKEKEKKDKQKTKLSKML